jgi:sarcosine oxidase/L-pipecolate oxidase
MIAGERASVLIVGGGTFGVSAAYHLCKRGYTNITLIDRFCPPSCDAAGTDINKTIRFDYVEEEYVALAKEAMKAWQAGEGPLAGLFHRTGWIMSASNEANAFIDATYRTAQAAKSATARISPAEIKQKFPDFTGSFDGWRSLWGPEAGWVRN